MRFIYVKDIRKALRVLKEHLKKGGWREDCYYGLLEHDGWVLPYWDTSLSNAGNSFIPLIEPFDKSETLKCFLRMPLNELVKEAIRRAISKGYAIEIHTKDSLASWLRKYINERGIDTERWIDEWEFTGRDMVEMLAPIEKRIRSYIKKHSKPEKMVKEGDLALMKVMDHCDVYLAYEIYFFNKEHKTALKRMTEEFIARAEVDPFYCEHCGMPYSLAVGRWDVYEVNAEVLRQAQKLQTS